MSQARIAGLTLFGILLGALGPTVSYANNSLTAAEKKAGWILLFDGTNPNTHWHQGSTGNNTSNVNWTVEDSSMKTNDAYAFICTRSADQYSDFEWAAEWRLGVGGNSGMFIRVVSDTYNDGYEYAILDDKNGRDLTAISHNADDELPASSGGKMAYIKRAGAIYDIYPTTKDGQVGGQYYDSTVSRPNTEWSQSVIWAEGNHIEHYLNQKKVVVAEIGSADWQSRCEHSKWWGYNGEGQALSNADRATWAKHPKGQLCLQSHAGGEEGKAWFRNLKVRPFTIGEVLVSPSATPNGGSFSTTAKAGLEVAITGAVIHYTLDGSEPTETSPTYTDSIPLTATTTLKAKTFRARFAASPTTTLTFTKAGTAIWNNDLSARPAVSMAPMSQGFLVQNTNGTAFSGSVFDLNGSKVADFSVKENMKEYPVTGLKNGVYLVKLQRGSWIQTQKIALH